MLALQGARRDMRGAASSARQFLTELESRGRAAAEAVSLLSAALQFSPGRKHIVFVSEGYPLDAPRVVREIVSRLFESTIMRGRQADATQH